MPGPGAVRRRPGEAEIILKILVLGAGVIGVTSAYYLAKAGHAVTVLDRENAAAEETSFGNAGQISPGYSAPWAAPGIPLTALKWLLTEHSPLIIRPGTDPALYVWLAKMLRNCTTARYRRNKGRMLRLAEYSRDCLGALRQATGIHYDEETLGTLQLLRTEKQRSSIAKDIAVLDEFGVNYQVLDRDGCIAAEPALARVAQKFVGGLRLPGDETGDCNLFTKRLADIAKAESVAFQFGRKVARLVADGDRVRVALEDGALLDADAILLAMGSYSPLLLKPLGLDLPVYPVKGYSITLPVADSGAAPVSTVMDERYKIAITRLGDRIRVGGRAELAGYDLTLRPQRRAALEHSLQDLFPGGGDIDKASFWTGLRPMTPDGTPVIGPTRYSNLFLNTGHGTLGWTMACGSGRVIADIISGRRTEIESADLALARYV